jgi:DNA-binding beta-propeller fold protein YncE
VRDEVNQGRTRADRAAHRRVMALAVCMNVFFGVATTRVAHDPARPVLTKIEDVPIPGPPVRFDYQSIDTTSNRLYVSHMNAGELVVVDLKSRRVEAEVRGLPRVTGVWVVPSLGKVYASVPGTHQVAIIDARTLRVAARVGKIGFPDGIAYAPTVKKIYVSDESGGGELVIDGRSDRVVADIPIGGEAGNTIFDPGSGHVLVAVQTRNEVIAIDPRTDRILGRHKLEGADHPHGMCMDAADRLLFVANEGNGSLLTFDLRTMRVIGSHRVGDDPDVLAFDPLAKKLYVASESGVVTVFTRHGTDLVKEGDIVVPHAHTVSVDPRTHQVYLPLQNVDGHPVLRIMADTKP